MKPCFDSLSSARFKLWYHSWPYVPESTTINPCLKRVIFYPTCPELPTFLVVSNLKDRCSFPDHISKIIRNVNFCFLDISLKFTRPLVFLYMLYSSCWFFSKPIIFVLLQTESITWPIVMHLEKSQRCRLHFIDVLSLHRFQWACWVWGSTIFFPGTLITWHCYTWGGRQEGGSLFQALR